MNRFSGRLLLIGLTLVFVSACETEQTAPESPDTEASALQLSEIWTLAEGLNRPESVVYDPEQDALYVSNINGDGSEKDGNGYLSKVSTTGQMVEEQWVTGLNAPKGLALSGNRLYASDIDELVEIDPATGEITARYPAEGAAFLNDVAAGPDGSVYVSDSRVSKLYRLQGGNLSLFLEDGRVMAPNGVHIVEGRLVVAAGDSTIENAGGARYLQSVSLDGQEIAPLSDRTPIGSVDAVEPDERGGLFLTDWGAGKVMHYAPENGVTTLLEVSQGTADLEYVPDTQTIYLPVMMSDRLIAYRVERSE